MSTPGTASAELLIAPLDRGRPLRAQLEAELRTGTQTGRLRPGTRLPSTRALAHDLGLSRRLVVEAYAQLVAEGHLVSRGGSGTRVRSAPATREAGRAPGSTVVTRRPAWAPAAAEGLTGAPRLDLFPGAPDLARFPRRAWSAALRAVLVEVPDRRLGYGDPSGAPELRIAAAERLGRVRGAVADEQRLLICGGYTQAVRLLLEVLVARGACRVAIEEPGYPLNRHLVSTAGLEPVPVAADHDGLDVAALQRAGAIDAVIVTPAHGLPLGGVLAPGRRAALVSWARATGALVIEDDYDAEFRYDGEPVGTLQGLAPDVVALVGTVSKTLAPALRIGWLLAPPELSAALQERRALLDLGSPLLDQLALARLIAAGGLDRHVRTLRPHYRARRDAVVAALATELPEARVHGVAAGLHVLVELPPGTQESALVRAAEREGLRLYGLARHCCGPPPFSGIVLGYASASPAELTRAVRTIARLLAAQRTTTGWGRAASRPRPSASPGS